MTFQTVCDAWSDDLINHITGLEGAKVHLYAPWSVENLSAAQGERHLAVYPTAQSVQAVPAVLADKPGDFMTQTYAIVVWEEAASEGTRLYDDDEKNQEWLALFEQILGRLYVQSNTSLGVDSGYTRFTQMTFGLQALVRFMTINFEVRFPQMFT